MVATSTKVLSRPSSGYTVETSRVDIRFESFSVVTSMFCDKKEMEWNVK